MKLRFTTRAVNDLKNIADYFEGRNPAAGRRILRAIYEAIRTVASFPQSGRRQNVQSVRKFVARRYPYLIFYSVDAAADRLVILTIRHPAQERDFEDA